MKFIEALPKKTLAKGEILLKKGDKCQGSYYVVSGCLKSYIVDASGKEHILQFAPENWMVTDLDSILNDVPSSTFIEAVETSELRVLSKSFLQSLKDLGKEELLEQNKKLIRNILALNRRLASILASAAKERYLEFCEVYPSLVQRLPLKLIASYIGITPEYLSEIRRQIAKTPKPVS